MDRKKACKILRIQEYTDETVLKKKYREMMQLAHPDNHASEKCIYDAREINEAYEFLKKHPAPLNKPQRSASVKNYNAPINKNAYMERNIYHRIEGEEGEILGTIEIGRGKYYWTKDEEFSLFLLSIYNCTQELLSKCPPMNKDRQTFLQGELSLLLAKQFIEQEKTLSALVKHVPDTDGTEVYTIPASLELLPNAYQAKQTDNLRRRHMYENESINYYPSKLFHHRLYLKDEQGTEVGYLSLADDRLYYIIIPIFEDHRVQVKCASKGSIKNNRFGKRYIDLTLLLRFIPNAAVLPENDSIKIDNLLRKEKAL